VSRPKGTGSVYRRKGSPSWWIKYSRAGRSFCESTKTHDKNKALKLLKLRLGEIATGTFLGPEIERVRIQDLAEDFLREYRINGRKSVEDAATRWNRHLRPFFGHIRVIEVTGALITQYVEARQCEAAANATINRELAALKRMFTIGRQHRRVRDVPVFPHLVENNARKGFLDDGQFKELVEGADLWFRALVECGRTYGWRVSELLNLRVSQVDLLARTIRLEPGTTKNRDGREVTMTQPVCILLTESVRGKKSTEYLFTRKDGSVVRDFRDTWKKACVRAGLGRMFCRNCESQSVSGTECEFCKHRKQPSRNLRYSGLIFHDLRRTAARNLRRAGIAEGVIMKIGGWRTRSVFERYAIIDQNDIAVAMEKLQNLQAGEQKQQISYNIGYSPQQHPASMKPASTN
jgi:integrase